MTIGSRRIVRLIGLMVVAIICAASSALAQSQVRVVKDSTLIWRRDAPGIVVATVKTGTVLDVVGQEGAWYIVVLPPESGGRGQDGLIAVSQVVGVGGGEPTRQAAPPSPPPVNQRSVTSAQGRRLSPVPRHVEVFGFGDVGYGTWLAHDTFRAVLGSANGPMFGGGAQVRVGRLFIEGAADYFQKSGVRVFVNQGTVFSLGIADTVRVIPVSATVGYRHPGRKVTPYVGGGVGAEWYRERSDFADPSENPSEQFVSYHVLAGVELRGRGLLRSALEVQFTTVPNALGASGVSAAFNEHNLGSVYGRLKIMVGR